MNRVSVRTAREQLSDLLDRVSAGEEIVITRHGKEVARLVSSTLTAQRTLPSLTAFRAAIKVKGAPLSATVSQGRSEERY